MKESKLFTRAENKILQERIKGSRKDPHGIYAGRVKPKLKEILEWIKKADILSKLLKED